MRRDACINRRPDRDGCARAAACQRNSSGGRTLRAQRVDDVLVEAPRADARGDRVGIPAVEHAREQALADVPRARDRRRDRGARADRLRGRRAAARRRGGRSASSGRCGPSAAASRGRRSMRARVSVQCSHEGFVGPRRCAHRARRGSRLRPLAVRQRGPPSASTIVAATSSRSPTCGAPLAGRQSSRPAHEQRHLHRILVQRVLPPQAALAELVAVVGRVDDERVVGEALRRASSRSTSPISASRRCTSA